MKTMLFEPDGARINIDKLPMVEALAFYRAARNAGAIE